MALWTLLNLPVQNVARIVADHFVAPTIPKAPEVRFIPAHRSALAPISDQTRGWLAELLGQSAERYVTKTPLAPRKSTPESLYQV